MGFSCRVRAHTATHTGVHRPATPNVRRSDYIESAVETRTGNTDIGRRYISERERKGERAGT